MSWADPGLVVVGEVIESAWGNNVRNSILASAPGVAMAKGDVFVGTGLNAIRRQALNGTARQALRINDAGDDVEWGEPKPDLHGNERHTVEYATVEELESRLPAGVIVMWSGSIANIPVGWVLCDGNNGTPDLRDRFIVGAGSTYSPGATGGAISHSHGFSGITGDAQGGHGTAGGTTATFSHHPNHQHSFSGTTNDASSLPPYYALAYIMKT